MLYRQLKCKLKRNDQMKQLINRRLLQAVTAHLVAIYCRGPVHLSFIFMT
jgi:hypothetical protein